VEGPAVPLRPPTDPDQTYPFHDGRDTTNLNLHYASPCSVHLSRRAVERKWAERPADPLFLDADKFSGQGPALLDERQRLFTGVYCPFQLAILSHGQHLGELWPGLVSGFDQVLPVHQ
jgi:hypothetical protein